MRAQDATRLTDAQIVAVAERLRIDPNALRAIIKVESAGPGFSNGRPLLSFEPYHFSDATGGRFDSSNPGVSSGTSRAYLGGGQDARWAKLAEAYALAPDAALGAASWGAFQLPGRYYADAGYPSVYAFVQDMAQSESRQLAAFEAYLSRKELVDELQRLDWAAFARAYEGEAGGGQYAGALQRAYATLAPPAPDAYLDSLIATSRQPLTDADYEAVATELGCEVAVVKAVVRVESGTLGAYGSDGRPTILFEPHKFSQRTGRRYDASHPHLSYQPWDPNRYPRGQAARWAQMREAYALDQQAAVASASWGLFQIMGFNFDICGYADPKAFVSEMSASEATQLRAFARFVRGKNLVDEMREKRWEDFAYVYNGSGQAVRYGRLLADAYAALTRTS